MNGWVKEAAEQGREFLARAPSCCSEPGFVYIIQADRLVKIGMTANIVQRMRTLQASSPAKVHLVALGRGARWERLFHTWFDEARHHGEWFAADAVEKWLSEFVDDHCVCCELKLRRPDE